MLEVLDISFDEVAGELNLSDIYDITEVVTVNVGENNAGNYYNLILVTNKSISRLEDKRNIFKIEKWEGLDSLKSKLNAFIKEKVESNAIEDPFVVLSKYWKWEYEGYNS